MGFTEFYENAPGGENNGGNNENNATEGAKTASTTPDRPREEENVRKNTEEEKDNLLVDYIFYGLGLGAIGAAATASIKNGIRAFITKDPLLKNEFLKSADTPAKITFFKDFFKDAKNFDIKTEMEAEFRNIASYDPNYTFKSDAELLRDAASVADGKKAIAKNRVMLFRLFEGVNDSNFNYSNVKNRNIISENFNREIWDLINKNKGLREALEGNDGRFRKILTFLNRNFSYYTFGSYEKDTIGKSNFRGNDVRKQVTMMDTELTRIKNLIADPAVSDDIKRGQINAFKTEFGEIIGGNSKVRAPFQAILNELVIVESGLTTPTPAGGGAAPTPPHTPTPASTPASTPPAGPSVAPDNIDNLFDNPNKLKRELERKVNELESLGTINKRTRKTLINHIGNGKFGEFLEEIIAINEASGRPIKGILTIFSQNLKPDEISKIIDGAKITGTSLTYNGSGIPQLGKLGLVGTLPDGTINNTKLGSNIEAKSNFIRVLIKALKHG